MTSGPVTGPEWTLKVHDLALTVRESARRRTVSMGVERDGELLILAPKGVEAAQLRRLVLTRQDWLYARLAEKAQLHRTPPTREYVNGEGFLFAGRSYRLLLVPRDPDGAALRLSGGRFELQRDHVAEGRETFIGWYSEQLLGWTEQHLHRGSARLRVTPNSVRVTDLGHRWGTCSAGGGLALHWRVALLPRRIAQYVLLHELVHLEFHHHRAPFWERLGVLLPDYAERKTWLALHGAEYDL